MSRPRIIIADTDVNYIQSLQLKFIEEFFEKIDLEIITERKYFDELFSVPQKAEILVVSEDLYESSLQRHNISKVFLMVEQDENDGTEELNVDKIFKYSSIKEIFNRIFAKAGKVLNIDNIGKQKPQIITVTSACGGVGKTTIAMGLSSCLSKSYKKVLYLNTDFIQSFLHLLKDKTPIRGNQVYMELIKNEASIYHEVSHLIRKEIFDYLPPLKAAAISLGIKREVYLNIAELAKRAGDYDFIIVDTDSNFDEFKTKLLDKSDKVVVVLDKRENTIRSTLDLIENISDINQEKYSFICNCIKSEEEKDKVVREVSNQFQINEFIEKTNSYEEMSASDFANINGLKKATYIFM